MTDPRTLTAEYRSWQWELVLQYEDGSLPASDWNAATLTTITDWYAGNLTREQATARYEDHYHRNHRRLTNRLDNAAVATDAIESLDTIWQMLLENSLTKFGK